MKSKILIIEDEILIADNLQDFLEKNNFDVVGIGISYEEAVELYEQFKPDLILLDIRLYGEKSGIDFAYYLQKQSKLIPFIYLTSQVDLKTIQTAKVTFPAGYISKPIQKDGLLASIEVALHKYITSQIDQTTISLNDGYNNFIIHVNDILFLKSDHVYVNVHLISGRQILQRGSLKELLEKVPNGMFVQTHRSFAVNLKQVSHWDNKYLYIQTKKIPVSRSRRALVTQHLSTN